MHPLTLDSLDTISNKYHKPLEWQCQTCERLGATLYVEYQSEALSRVIGERICTTCLTRRSGITKEQIRELIIRCTQPEG